jgi:hypothetical protein
LGEFGDKSMEAIVLAETDEVVKTTIKILTSPALRKRLFHLFFILFVDVDTNDFIVFFVSDNRRKQKTINFKLIFMFKYGTCKPREAKNQEKKSMEPTH